MNQARLSEAVLMNRVLSLLMEMESRCRWRSKECLAYGPL